MTLLSLTYRYYISQHYLEHLALGCLQRDHHHLASVRAYLEDTRVITLFLIDEAVYHCSFVVQVLSKLTKEKILVKDNISLIDT